VSWRSLAIDFDLAGSLPSVVEALSRSGDAWLLRRGSIPFMCSRCAETLMALVGLLRHDELDAWRRAGLVTVLLGVGLNLVISTSALGQ